MNTNNTTPAQRPILFSTPMVQAILAGRKTETRRVVKGWGLAWLNEGFTPEFVAAEGNIENVCPYGHPGTVLWVRETWQQRNDKALKLGFDKYYYKADFKGCTEAGWKPSIHMPKAAARIWLQVTEIKVERLQDITDVDAINEGVETWESPVHKNLPTYQNYLNPCLDKSECVFLSPKLSFQTLWQSINGPDSWESNPWVWVVKFKVLSTTGKPQNL